MIKTASINRHGYILLYILVIGVVLVSAAVSLIGWTMINLKSIQSVLNRELAIHIAEAGIDYYRWHLSHAANDYYDGTCDPEPCEPGPYTHYFEDKDGNVIGQFILEITPPPIGSTVVTIKSTGKTNANLNVLRAIQTQLAIPSFARYSTVSNSDIRFGPGTEVFGPIHSNKGIRFDGLAHNFVSSSKNQYDDLDHGAGDEHGVHTHVDLPPASGVPDGFRPLEAPPNPLMNRPDVFEAGRQVGVPAVDFTGITADLADIKSSAQDNGYYFAHSGALGYHIILKTDDTFDLYTVSSLVPLDDNCSYGLEGGQLVSGVGSWSIAAGGETFSGNNVFPDNGLIFVEDHVWVDGQINTARITIASGVFPDNPATWTNIIVNEDLLYTNYDGQDTISLIAQGNIRVGLVSDNDLRIDAAIVAQNDQAGRPYYKDSAHCSMTYAKRNSIILYGTIVSNKRYGFSWSSGGAYVSGYLIRNLIYDANLLYTPPPSFPLTSDQYSIISWSEVK